MRKSFLPVLMSLLLMLGAHAQPISEQEALQKAQQFLQGKNIVSPKAICAVRQRLIPTSTSISLMQRTMMVS